VPLRFAPFAVTFVALPVVASGAFTAGGAPLVLKVASLPTTVLLEAYVAMIR